MIETETLQLTHFLLWVWNGSRYSGLICMVLSSTIYFSMELISDNFAGKYHLLLLMVLKSRATFCVLYDII